MNEKYICKKTYLECVEGKSYEVFLYCDFLFSVIVCDSDLCPGESFVYDLEKHEFDNHFISFKNYRKQKLEKISKNY
jgi:hypothetical protein